MKKKKLTGKCEWCGIRYIPKTFDYHKHCKDARNKTIEKIKYTMKQING